MKATHDTGKLEHAIFNTIRYFDLFDLPVTATQIWRSLIVEGGSHIRWGGVAAPSLARVRETLQTSPWLQRQIGSRWGYYFLQGKEHTVRERLHRHTLAQHKWKIARRVAKLMAYAPFVRMLAGSGSLAIDNTNPQSDLDIFVVAARGRIWTARLFLLVLAQLSGRRRKYWDRKAPDKVCLNHYVTEEAMATAGEIRNLYTAMLYSHLVPLYGLPAFAEYQRLNGAWIKERLMYLDPPTVPHCYAVHVGRRGLKIKRIFEELLREPVGDALERWAERWQRRVIMRHTLPGRSGRISLSAEELAFHPDSKVPDILARFEQDVGQKQLL